MAKAKTYSFGGIIVTIGDNGTPELFTAPCGLSQKTFTRNKDTNATQVPDCANPDAATWDENDVVSRNWSLSGSGLLTKEAKDMWTKWYNSDEPRNIKVQIPGTGAEGGETSSGAAHLNKFEISGQRGNRWEVSVDIVGTGPLETVPAA